MGYCQREVFVDVLPETGPRLSYCDLTPETVHEFLEEIFVRGNLRNRFLLGRIGDGKGPLADIPPVEEVPFFRHQKKVVLENCGQIDPTSLDSALAAGVFRAAAKALHTVTPVEALRRGSGVRPAGTGRRRFPHRAEVAGGP